MTTTTNQMSGITIEGEVQNLKDYRRRLTELAKEIKQTGPSRERSLAITKVEEATMWLGMDLKRIGELHPDLLPNPYPNSKDPSNSVIDRTAPEIS